VDTLACRLLDTLILYLRVVYSFDYYNATEYQQEDLMPYRCGVLHVRGSHLKAMSSAEMTPVIYGDYIRISYDPTAPVNPNELADWCRIFEIHARQFVDPARDTLDLAVARRLGWRDPAEERRTFIAANTQQLEPDVWYCPLSDKRFKGADYVRKHIETKHGEKLAELDLDCEYFNRFLLDPKRPYLPEHPLSRSSINGGGVGIANGGQYGQQASYQPGLASLMAAGTSLMGPVPGLMSIQPVMPASNSYFMGGGAGGGYDEFGSRSQPAHHYRHGEAGSYYDQDYNYGGGYGAAAPRYGNYDRYSQQSYSSRGGSGGSYSSVLSAQGRLVDTRRK
jgi:hypothetical protein